jgi:hypothetical protein
MVAPEEINADMLAFWNGKGGDTWVSILLDLIF